MVKTSVPTCNTPCPCPCACKNAGYSHWAFGDVDVVYGSLRRFLLVPAVLRHDVVSLRADDLCRSRRTLFAGQLTVLQHAQHYSTLHTLEYIAYSVRALCMHN